MEKPRIFMYDGVWCVDWHTTPGDYSFEKIVSPIVRWIHTMNGWVK